MEVTADDSNVELGRRRDRCFVASGICRELGGEIKGGEVVDARRTPDELVMALKERQIRDAIILRVPAENEAELVGLG